MAYNSQVRFEWDESKNRSNQVKHGVSFEEARSLFESGVDFLEIFDVKSSIDEDRFIAIGPIVREVVLVVWIDRVDATIRIISARMATAREKALFMERMRETQ